MASAAPVHCASKSAPPRKSAHFGPYIANLYFDPDANTKDAYYEILQGGRRVYVGRATENGERFAIGTLYDDDPDAKLVAMGRDITGDGQPDLVIAQWSGGANCCLTLHLFEIGPRFRKIGDIDAAFGDQGPHFVHLETGPGLQIQIYDWTFANWHADFADSPAPKVILRYKDGAYRIAPDLMRTASIDSKALGGKLAQVKSDAKDLRGGSWPEAAIPPSLWAAMLDLIYQGHQDAAWQFMNQAWPPSVGGKARFKRDFIAQLRRSPYAKSIMATGS